MAQAVRRSPPTAGVLSSRLGHSMWVSWWTKRGISRFPLPQISFHHFSILISSTSFHFISPFDGASGVVGRHPCHSLTYNIGASSHLIPRPDLVLDTSWGYLFIYTVSSLAWQSLAILRGECMWLRAHYYTARNSDIHAPIVLPWFFTSRARWNAVWNSQQAPLNTPVYCHS